MDAIELAAVLVTLALLASMVSVELGVTVALIELTLGVVAGNVFDLQSQDWLTFIAAFASIVLTFLAGMEVDPAYMRRRLTASVGIGVVSFIGPFVVASLVAYLVLDWSGRASLIAGTALSTTSLAVVYAVLVERGLTDTSIGKLLMSATFVTDLCTALALLGDLHQAERLVPGVPRRLAGADPRAAAHRALVLRALRRPGDRAGDQARVRLSAAPDGAGRRVERARRAPGVRARPRHEPALRRAPRGAEAAARRRVRVPDAVLLHQGRAERLARRRSSRTSACSRSCWPRRWSRSSASSTRSPDAPTGVTRRSRRC